HYHETLTIIRQINDRFSEGGAHNYYALGLTLLGDPAGAAIAAQAFALLSVPQYPWGQIIALEVPGAQAGMRGSSAIAGRLIGAARQLRQQHQIEGSAIFRGDYEKLFAIARGSTDTSSWAEALAAGADLSHDRLLQLAEQLL
ncbi:MAG TPA: hypothetical protein PKC19_22870, partial [Roseiflexaceae bacterium]|nr:hypothetical protein [Roseiflexaceae bacterium]